MLLHHRIAEDTAFCKRSRISNILLCSCKTPARRKTLEQYSWTPHYRVSATDARFLSKINVGATVDKQIFV